MNNRNESLTDLIVTFLFALRLVHPRKKLGEFGTALWAIAATQTAGVFSLFVKGFDTVNVLNDDEDSQWKEELEMASRWSSVDLRGLGLGDLVLQACIAQGAQVRYENDCDTLEPITRDSLEAAADCALGVEPMDFLRDRWNKNAPGAVAVSGNRKVRQLVWAYGLAKSGRLDWYEVHQFEGLR